MSDINGAIHWWLSENCTTHKEVLGRIRALLGSYFTYAHSLIYILKDNHLPPRAGFNGDFIFRGSEGSSYFINLPQSPDKFFQLRGILALIGDMIILSMQIRNLSKQLDNNELKDLLDLHLPNMGKYRNAGNFFAHLDERLENTEKHGVTGELEVSELNFIFKPEAKGYFYLVCDGDTMFFHDQQRNESMSSPKSISFNKEGLKDLILLIRAIYDLITSHSVHARNYIQSEQLFNF